MKEEKAVNPVSVRIKMLNLSIKSKDIKEYYGCSDAAVSMALAGQRMDFLRKINKWLTQLSNRKRKRELKKVG